MTRTRQEQLPSLSDDTLRTVTGGATLGSVIGGDVGSLIDRTVNPVVIGGVLRHPPGSFPTR